MQTHVRTAVLATLWCCGTLLAADRPASEWGFRPAPDQKISYKTTPAGDRIMAFSSAGYMGGGVALPDVPARQTIKPAGGDADDDTAAIQRAIDEVGKLPADDKGFRGAVLLTPGTFRCVSTINLSASGI